MTPFPAAPAPIVLPGLPAGGDDLPPLVWEPYGDGIAASWLYRTGPDGPAAAFLRYQPGGRTAPHSHPGYEHVWVLEGELQDATGRHEAGTLLVHPPGFPHSVSSPDGCLLLVMWERADAIVHGAG